MQCKRCGKPISQPKGSGRPRTYCSDLCRNDAYVERRNASRPPPAPAAAARDVGYQAARDQLETIRPRDRKQLDRWIAEGTKFDEIIDHPEILARFMDELLVRIATHALFEDYQYQRALNQMIIIFFMVGRMTEGDYALPTIARERATPRD